MWGNQGEEQLQEVRAAVANYIVIETQLPNYEMVLIRDSSNKGGGGGLWQWQPLDPDHSQDFGPSTKANSKRELVPHWEHYRLVPLGHWGWKGNKTRSHYSVWEQELLAGILLLSSQEQTLKLAPSITWLCDQSACSAFKDGDSPQDPRRLR